jgi:hypothetical protein
MANDREVLKHVWDGKVPIKFVAEPDKDLEEQNAYFLLIPRVSYLPLVTDKVRINVKCNIVAYKKSLLGQETLSTIR